MKVKIFEASDHEKVAAKANEFLRNVKCISTQLTIRPAYNETFTQYVILITYED